jgi:hypothetical protein
VNAHQQGDLLVVDDWPLGKPVALAYHAFDDDGSPVTLESIHGMVVRPGNEAVPLAVYPVRAGLYVATYPTAGGYAGTHQGRLYPKYPGEDAPRIERFTLNVRPGVRRGGEA